MERLDVDTLTATERATEDQDLMPWCLGWSWVQSYMQQQNTLCIVEPQLIDIILSNGNMTFHWTTASEHYNALHTVVLGSKLAQGKYDAFVRDSKAAPEPMVVRYTDW